MTNAVNIFTALAAPLLIAVFLLRGEARRFNGFFLLGLAACFLSAHINGFLTAASGIDITEAALRITPISEEIIKALPVFFFIAVFSPQGESILAVSIAVGLGFATLENTFYIFDYRDANLLFALIRGFSAGAMHTVCATIFGYGLTLILKYERLVFPGSFALLCATSTFHATYNLLVTTGGAWAAAGYIAPIITAAALLPFVARLFRENPDEKQP